MATHPTSARLIAIVVSAAGCTPGEEPARTGAATAPAVITLTATDYAFEAPDSIPAGFTTFRLVNRSEQFHMAQLIKLEAGRTLADFLPAYGQAFRTAGPRPEWATRLGGPGVAEPHGEAAVTQHLEAGNYAWICLVNPPPDGIPHVLKGMAHPFVVLADSAAAARTAPEAAVVIRLADYGFSVSAPLTAGRLMIRVENTGAEPHELGLVKLAPGKNRRDFEAWLENLEGPPPASLAGGVASLAAAKEAYFEADLTPGDYVLFCLVTAPDGRPHTAHGMIQQVHIG